MARKIYQFKVTLRGIMPPIWRRVQVYDDLTFYQFHHVLQAAMGWWDAHLHQFMLNGEFITDAQTVAEMWEDGEEHRKVQLKQRITQTGQKFIYEYDFGDSWEHEVLLEKVLPVEADAVYPRCLKGKRACPPEDCGGVWGYEEMLEALADADHPEHDMYIEWLDGDFDAEAFDLDSVNAALARL